LRLRRSSQAAKPPETTSRAPGRIIGTRDVVIVDIVDAGGHAALHESGEAQETVLKGDAFSADTNRQLLKMLQRFSV
jgi:hypothetical protein